MGTSADDVSASSFGSFAAAIAGVCWLVSACPLDVEVASVVAAVVVVVNELSVVRVDDGVLSFVDVDVSFVLVSNGIVVIGHRDTSKIELGHT